MKNKKILFSVPTLGGGGAERVVSVLSSELAERGYDISVLLHTKLEKEYLLSDKVKLIRIEPNNNKTKNPLKRVGRLFHKIDLMRTVLKENNYDIVIPFLGHNCILMYTANLFLKNKYIFTVRNRMDDDRNTFFGKIMLFLQLKIATKSDAIFLQTEEQLVYFQEKNRIKTFIVPNPVNSKMFVTEVKEITQVRKVISLGRLHKQKNHEMLIDAFFKIKDSCSDLVLEIYGVGELYDILQSKIKSYGLTHRVTLCGRTEQPETVYQQADMFVLSSDYEGLPNALMEAMASGLPCISTACPTGPSDIIQHLENGLLVPVGGVNELAEAMKLLTSDVELANKLARNAHETAIKRFEKVVVVEQFVSELEDRLYG